MFNTKLFEKLFEKINVRWKSQEVKTKEGDAVASYSQDGDATSVIQAQVVVERHGYARTPTELFGDFDHAIRNYHRYGETEPVDPPALLVTDWDIMILQMLFRDNSPLKDRINIVNDLMTYQNIPLKHPTAGVLRMTPTQNLSGE